MSQKKKNKFRLITFVWSCLFVGFTAAALSASGRGDLAMLGGLMGLLIAGAWHQLVLHPIDLERSLGRERLALNLATQGQTARNLRDKRTIFAAGFLLVWLLAVIPPLTPQGRNFFSWLERHLRSEQAVLRIEYPSYLDTPAQEFRLKGDLQDAPEMDADAYLSVSFKYRKPDSRWMIAIANPSDQIEGQTQPVGQNSNFGHSARSILEKLSLSPEQEHVVKLTVIRNSKQYASQLIKITPQPRPVVEIKKSTSGSERAGQLGLDVKARSKIPLSAVELHVRTASGYRMVKPVAEFANANQQTFDGTRIPFNTAGIPFTAKDTLYVKAVAKTVAENLYGESAELQFEIITKENLRQDLIQALEKSLAALQSKSVSANELKETLSQELKKAQDAAQQMGQQSSAARQTEQIAKSAERIKSPRDTAAQNTEKKIKNLLERLKREQTAGQMQNLLARLQNLKLSIQRSPPEQLPALGKDASELGSAAKSLKKQLSELIDKPNSGLSLEERQAALNALKMDQTPENLKDLEASLKDKKQTESVNKAQSSADHAQKHLGGVLAMLQQARQRVLREAREKLTRADNQLQNARNDPEKSEKHLGDSQQDLDSLPDISNEFQDAASDAQKANQKARQGAEAGDRQKTQAGIDEAQDGIVRALAALQDEEEAERQSQQEQDGQNFRSQQEALAAQSQLDMGWRRQILEEIARLRAAGEPSDSPAIQYLESRLR
jgi:hypothetical protein